MRDFGSIPSPQNAYYLNIGLETLPLRVAQHCKNGQAAAEYLAAHPKVAWVNYPGLPGNKYHALAKKYMPDGTCGVVSFGVKGGREAASRFMAGWSWPPSPPTWPTPRPAFSIPPPPLTGR